MEVNVLNIKGQETGRKVTLNESIFGIEPNDHVLYLDVKQYLANQRQGTAKAKERSEHTGSTRKLGRQKGGGGARRGDHDRRAGCGHVAYLRACGDPRRHRHDGRDHADARDCRLHRPVPRVDLGWTGAVGDVPRSPELHHRRALHTVLGHCERHRGGAPPHGVSCRGASLPHFDERGGRGGDAFATAGEAHAIGRGGGQ